ncbi:MAG: periplasmic-type flagellar collar protein FlbB [Spirochaetota bacterium]
MVRMVRPRAFPRILLFGLLLLGLVTGGLLWFDYLGLVDAVSVIRPAASAVGLSEGGPPDPTDPGLLDTAREQKAEDALALREEELDRQEEELEARASELEVLEQELRDREAELAEREVSFNQRVEQYENRRAVLEQNARDLTNMPPNTAVDILVGYEDQLLIDTLRVTEELAQAAGEVSLVPVWLAGMPADRVATIQRKMTVKPEE